MEIASTVASFLRILVRFQVCVVSVLSTFSYTHSTPYSQTLRQMASSPYRHRLHSAQCVRIVAGTYIYYRVRITPQICRATAVDIACQVCVHHLHLIKCTLYAQLSASKPSQVRILSALTYLPSLCSLHVQIVRRELARGNTRPTFAGRVRAAHHRTRSAAMVVHVQIVCALCALLPRTHYVVCHHRSVTRCRGYRTAVSTAVLDTLEQHRAQVWNMLSLPLYSSICCVWCI